MIAGHANSLHPSSTIRARVRSFFFPRRIKTSMALRVTIIAKRVDSLCFRVSLAKFVSPVESSFLVCAIRGCRFQSPILGSRILTVPLLIHRTLVRSICVIDDAARWLQREFSIFLFKPRSCPNRRAKWEILSRSGNCTLLPCKFHFYNIFVRLLLLIGCCFVGSLLSTTATVCWPGEN